jgi:hypothetical protein
LIADNPAMLAQNLLAEAVAERLGLDGHRDIYPGRQSPGSVAWQHFIVEPLPSAEVTWASGSFDSPQA